MDVAGHPLFEFDDSPVAVINPSIHKPINGFPERAVVTWFGDVFRRKFASQQPVYVVPFEHGPHPVYVMSHNGHDVAVVNTPVGAPAAVAIFESLIAIGARKIIGCGGAGIIREGFDVGHVIVPTGAVRDEGTSHHYAPVHAEVAPHPEALGAIDATLTDAGVPHDKGMTWTTDAFFRETPAKVARRREQGCISVEMEVSAMFAAAAFRGVVYGQLLYAGDDVSAHDWDHRNWDSQTSARERLLDLAVNSVCRL
jgi:uridine phosphorylase